MQEERGLPIEERDEQREFDAGDEQPETSEHPAPGIKHVHEPDAENIMPTEDKPGTF